MRNTIAFYSLVEKRFSSLLRKPCMFWQTGVNAAIVLVYGETVLTESYPSNKHTSKI